MSAAIGPASFSRERRLPDVLAACSREELLGYVQTLERRALHDPLTGLANRALLEDRLQQAVALSSRHQSSFALLICDLDRFKEVNDSHGHELGDAALRAVADRLLGVLRASDSVARLGGDEFAVLLPETDRAGAEIVAGKISAEMRSPLRVRGVSVSVGVSVGVSMFPEDGADAATLVRRADSLMYGVKGRRRRAPLRRLTRALAVGVLVALGAIVVPARPAGIAVPEGRVSPSTVRPPIAAATDDPVLGGLPDGGGFVAARRPAPRMGTAGNVVVVSRGDAGSEDNENDSRTARRRSSPQSGSGTGVGAASEPPEQQRGGGSGDTDDDESDGKPKGRGKGGGGDDNGRRRRGNDD